MVIYGTAVPADNVKTSTETILTKRPNVFGSISRTQSSCFCDICQITYDAYVELYWYRLGVGDISFYLLFYVYVHHDHKNAEL